MTLPKVVRIIRWSAAYDLVVTFMFALPWTAALVFTGLAVLHESLGLGGTTPNPDDVFTLMFANLMGSIVTVWAVFRIVRPSIAAGAADTGARLLFSLGMATALMNGASPLTAVLLVPEMAWAVVQGVAVISTRMRASVPV